MCLADIQIEAMSKRQSGVYRFNTRIEVISKR